MSRDMYDTCRKTSIADRAGFEPAVDCSTTVFKTVSFGRSDTCPLCFAREAQAVTITDETDIGLG